MSETNAPTQTTPAEVKRTIAINGQNRVFAEHITSRGKAHKGKPVLVPVYKNAADPELTEIVENIVAFGQKSLCKDVAKTLKKICIDASYEAVRQDAEGKYSIDVGAFQTALGKEVAALESGAKDLLLAELEQIDEEINKAMAEVMPLMAKNQPVPSQLYNKLQQLITRQAGVKDKLKKGKRGGPKEDEKAAASK